MRTILLLLGLVLAVGLTQEATAQVSKAYAPDNLSGLNEADRVRVIEREYADQSNGRRIPDDQLEFYLDQIRSGWRFTDIKNDISLSLGGTGAGWRPVPGRPGPGLGGEILCESRDRRPTECDTPWRGVARLSRQISSARCSEGKDWGSRPGMVWVSNGCRARFVEDDRYSPPIGGGGSPIAGEVVCESHNKRYTECRSPFRGDVELVRQFSDRGCKLNVDWGYRPGVIWVKDGCRGAFGPARGGHGGNWHDDYTVTCTSDDNRYRTCAWTSRSRPFLLEQLSRAACVEGRTWGYDPRAGLWVDRGCRGRFGVR
ncbi:DUF3011 domain-containing protein [Chiayiivirga flava]|uniref:DUF3011 domain-containing protein n=1 Tax=Chiayiivirga flava TaxID=659595 RepID=A0A7W8D3G0_9GAMM|nr:DUF3011 domain-containing protein [Chiayiivirga flava]MBB5207179.1 hypothetical protein [Chiayiivirga flava]